MVSLYEVSNRLIRGVETRWFRRPLFNKLNPDSRLIEISGSRGVGKTTLMLQKAYEINLHAPGKVLYTSLDDPWYYSNTIIEMARGFDRDGGKYLFLDEVHKYPPKHKDNDWSSELKIIYDQQPNLRVTYSGSSIIKLNKGKGDLSRRRDTYNLPGLSFREYLEFNNVYKTVPVTLEDITSRHTELAGDILSEIKPIPLIKKYWTNGYFPFYNENPEKYNERLKSIISVILETDIPSVADIPIEAIIKMKKLLAVVAGSAPYTPNLSKTGSELFITDARTLLKYLNLLDQSELISLLGKESRGNQQLRKPDKIYLGNPNYIQCFTSKDPDPGTVRETFFMNQLSAVADVKNAKKGDFLVNDNLVFEIGGRNKKPNQTKDIENAWMCLDDIETGFARTIPLWLFGFLY